MDSAEQAALSESDHDAQSKRFYETHRFSDYASEGKPGREALLKPMRRFDKLSVNLSLSSILVPSGVELNGKTNITFPVASKCILKILFHTDPDVQSSIAWSSHLDPLFSNNLERDSALSWQYFGSSLGFLRRYPGTQWPQDGSKDARPIHDFRTEDWFIQAASSPKDIVNAIYE